MAGSDFHRGIFPANSHLGRAGKTANAASIITSHSICHIRVGIRKRSPGLRRGVRARVRISEVQFQEHAYVALIHIHRVPS